MAAWLLSFFPSSPRMPSLDLQFACMRTSQTYNSSYLIDAMVRLRDPPLESMLLFNYKTSQKCILNRSRNALPKM